MLFRCYLISAQTTKANLPRCCQVITLIKLSICGLWLFRVLELTNNERGEHLSGWLSVQFTNCLQFQGAHSVNSSLLVLHGKFSSVCKPKPSTNLWLDWDSNHQPPDPKSTALTTKPLRLVNIIIKLLVQRHPIDFVITAPVGQVLTLIMYVYVWYIVEYVGNR